MATRGEIEVVGLTKEGNVMVRPTNEATMQILCDANRNAHMVAVSYSQVSRKRHANKYPPLRLAGEMPGRPPT